MPECVVEFGLYFMSILSIKVAVEWVIRVGLVMVGIHDDAR
jgi:hypothetical protein